MVCGNFSADNGTYHFKPKQKIYKLREADVLLAQRSSIAQARKQFGVLRAYPNAKSLTEVRPLDGLRINSPETGSGGLL